MALMQGSLSAVDSGEYVLSRYELLINSDHDCRDLVHHLKVALAYRRAQDHEGHRCGGDDGGEHKHSTGLQRQLLTG